MKAQSGPPPGRKTPTPGIPLAATLLAAGPRNARNILIAVIAAGLLAVACLAGIGGTARGSFASAVQGQERKEGALSLHSDLVVVSVTVTGSDGHYVQGLKTGDFALVEDAKPQSINSLATEAAPFAAAILIDMSGSMEYKFGLVRGAAASFLEHIREDDQVAVYGFNNKIRQFQDFSDSRNITDYIWDAKAEESTRLFDCMQTAVEALEKRPERRRAILVITDGWDTMSGATKESVTKRALAAGVTIYTVDLTDDELLVVGSDTASLRRGRSTLQDFATDTGGRYVHSPRGDKLEEAFDNVVDELRNQYTLTYYSTNEKRDGRWRAIGVSVPRPGVSVRARRGYYAPKK